MPMQPVFYHFLMFLELLLDTIHGQIDRSIGVRGRRIGHIIHMVSAEVAAGYGILTFGREVPLDVDSSLEVLFQSSGFLARVILEGFSGLEVFETELNEHDDLSFFHKRRRRI